MDYEAFSRYIVLYYQKDSNWKLVIFNEVQNVRQINFDYEVHGGGLSFDNVNSGGFIVNEQRYIDDPGYWEYKYYLINDNSDTPILFRTVNSSDESVNVYQYAYGDKIVVRSNNRVYEIYNNSGQKISEFNTADFTDNWSEWDFSFLSSNSSFVIRGYDYQNSNNVVLFYSGESNTFDYRLESLDLDYEMYQQKDYDNPSDFHAEGSALFMFYNNSAYLESDNNYYRSEVKFLPVWSSDTSLRNYFTFSYEKGVAINQYEFISRSENYMTTLIDNSRRLLYYFSDQGNNGITDGGDDMYDEGNYIYADSNQITYTHTQMNDDPDGGSPMSNYIMDGVVVTGASSSYFGPSSSYFTNMYPGLFVLAAQQTQIDRFEISGELGADGSGSQDDYQFTSTASSGTFQVYVKRVWDAQDPSVNHIILVNSATSSGITHSTSTNTDDDSDILEGLSTAGVNQIYYLLLALRDGVKLDDAYVESITSEFLNILDNSSDINDLLTNLNLNYTNIIDALPGDDNYSMLRFNRLGNDEVTIIPTSINKDLRIDSTDQLEQKTTIQFLENIQSAQIYGWGDLANLDTRKYSTFYRANNNGIGNNVVGQEFVMKDVANNEYWGIKFNWWESGNGAGFAYDRQKIVSGTFSGEIITFTHSSYSNDTDVISPGVLEITRGANGPIYNSALESQSNRRNPAGTLWNSQYTNIYDQYTHVVFDRQGQQIDSVVTQDFNNTWEGNVQCIQDILNNKTHISNSVSGQEWQTVNTYYDNDNNTFTAISESQIYFGNFILYNNNRFIIASTSSVTSEITIPLTEEFVKIQDRYISKNGLYVRKEYMNGNTLYFYNLQGDLIATKNIEGFYSQDDVSNYGDRLSIIWHGEDGIRKVIIFKGDSIEEINTGLTNLSYTVNDYYVWD
jgi:hypothetical protein